MKYIVNKMVQRPMESVNKYTAIFKEDTILKEDICVGVSSFTSAIFIRMAI